MGTLKRRHSFKRWAPDIGENRDLKNERTGEPEPALYLELAVGLTAEQLRETREALAADLPVLPDLDETLTGEALEAALKQRIEHLKTSLRARFTTALAPYVRVHAGPHTVDGQPLETLGDYVSITQGAADFGAWALKDLSTAFFTFNSFTGPDELFSLRRSGSSASTASPSVVKDEPKKEGS